MWACAVILVLAGLWGTALCRVQHCQKLEGGGLRLGGGVVHVVYSMERKCVLCYKEVNKLLTLKSRMAKFGHQMEVSVALNRPSTFNQRRQLPQELKVDDTQVWTELGKKNGHIFIFDKCGKLAYQVITPWSKQIYPFTGMAALSAILDNPCGVCNATSQEMVLIPHADVDPRPENSLHPVSGKHHSETSEALDYGGMRLKDSKLPLTIIYRSRHDHIESGRKISYNVVELRSNDPGYHGHAETGFVDKYDTSPAQNATTRSPETRTTAAPWPEYSYYDDYSDDVESPSSESTADEGETQDLQKHYQQLMKWMTCAQKIMST